MVGALYFGEHFDRRYLASGIFRVRSRGEIAPNSSFLGHQILTSVVIKIIKNVLFFITHDLLKLTGSKKVLPENSVILTTTLPRTVKLKPVGYSGKCWNMQ